MGIITRIINAFLKRFGNIKIKETIWDKEYKDGKWDYVTNTESDPIYEYINFYANGGMILDLGCGSGNTGCEIKIDRYLEYVGVDISTEAINKAKNRIMNDSERNKKNKYYVSDIETYTASNKFDVILFRESIYYIRKLNIKKVFDRYKTYLNNNGMIIVRLHDLNKYKIIVDMIIESYNIVDKKILDDTIIIVFN